jgi:hypothetical protein
MVWLVLDLDRRKWWVLIVVYVSYMCFNSYGKSIWTSLVTDFFSSYLTSNLMLSQHFFGDESHAGGIRLFVFSLFVDLLLRLLIIVAGASITAFLHYGLNLSTLRGLNVMYFFTVIFFRLWIGMLDSHRRTEIMVHANKPVAIILECATKNNLNASSRPLSDQKPHAHLLQGLFIDAKGDFLFWALVLVFTVSFTNYLIFGEPWTYALFYIFITSVFFLVLVLERPGGIRLQKVRSLFLWAWLSPLLFFLSWTVAIIIIIAVHGGFSSYKYKLSSYFE